MVAPEVRMCVGSSHPELAVRLEKRPGCFAAKMRYDHAMRVMHVVKSVDPGSGGPQAVICRLSAAQRAVLPPSGRVRVVSLAVPGIEEAFAKSIRDIPGIEQVEFLALHPGKCRDAILPRTTVEDIRRLCRDADILHLHGVWDRVLWTASVEARRARVPYVIMPHGMLDPWSLQQRAMKKKLAMFLYVRRMLNHACALHLLNEDESDLLAPLGLSVQSVVIPNGVFLEEIADLPPSDTFHAAHPELHGQPYILFLSRLHYKKGLDYLAAAFAIVARQYADVRLVVAGPDGGERENFQQWVKDAGIADRVHMVGPLYGSDKLAALSGARCFCLPSRQEGFSVAITEALGCGLPVVITEGCHFPQVSEVGAGIVTAPVPEQIAKALLHVLGDSGLRSRMSEAGRQLVRTELNWPSIARKTIAMYEAALGK